MRTVSLIRRHSGTHFTDNVLDLRALLINDILIMTYLMQLNLFEASVTLLLVVHIKYLYQFECDKLAVDHLLCLEYVREFSLA